MRVAIGCADDGYYIRQFDRHHTPDSYLAPKDWIEEEIAEVSDSVLRAYIALQVQEETMELLLGLIMKEQHPEL